MHADGLQSSIFEGGFGMNRYRRVVTAATVMVVAGTASAYGQEKIRLKFAHGYPANHFLWEEGGKVFADAVTSATNGRVEFDVFPANQLGKDSLAILNTGLADIAMITPAYLPSKMPLTAVTELPGMFSTSCEGSGKFQEIAKAGGALDENEYKPLGLHLLFPYSAPPFSLSTTSKSVTDLNSLAGLKIRVAGGAMAKIISSLGGVPVQLSAPEMYDALTRGTVDGAIYSRMSLAAIKLEEVLKYSVDGVRLGAGSIIVAMSDKAWNSMPDDVKAVMAEASVSARNTLCKWSDDREAVISNTLVEDKGWKINTLSDAEAKIWNTHMADVSKSWADELDASGRKGTAVLEAMRNATAGQ